DADEIKGRNTWMMWCGGNEAFWDWLAGHSYGFLDLLKLVASPDHQAGVLKRQRRFTDAGLINEPGCQTAAAQDEFRLLLEPTKDPLAPKPHEEIYGRSSGVIGLRLFKNPNFNANARGRWDAQRYFEDANYFNDPDLVRPYRVGMSCAFCHAAPHPAADRSRIPRIAAVRDRRLALQPVRPGQSRSLWLLSVARSP